MSHIRECFYLLSLVYSFIIQVSNKDKPLMENKKEHAATLYLLSDQFIKQKEGSQSVHTTKVVDLDIYNLLSGQKSLDSKVR